MKRAYSSVIIAGLALALIVNLWSLPVYPPPHCDEATYGSVGYDFLRSGRFKSNMTGDVFGFDQNYVAVGRLYALGMALFIQLLGVNLLTARLYSLAGGALTVWLTYCVARRVYDQRIGALAALLTAFSWKTLYAAHMGRPEIWLAAAVMFALWWLIRYADVARFWSTFVAGLICAAPFDFHALGIFFVAGLALAGGYHFGWVKRSWPALIGLGAGIATGLVVWAAIHFLPDPALAWRQWSVGYARMGLLASPSILTASQNFGQWFRENFIANNRYLGLIESGLYACGVIAAVRRRTPQSNMILTAFFGSLIAFALSNNQKSPQYAVVWIPLLSVLAAAVLGAVGRTLARLTLPVAVSEQWAAVIAAIPMLLLFLAGDIWLTIRYPSSAYEQMLTEMRHVIPPNSVVVGDTVWWWGFANDDYNFVGDWYFQLLAASQSPSPLTEAQTRAAVARLGANYVIVDESLACTITRDDPVQQVVARVAARACRLVAELPGPWLGRGSYESQFQFGQVSRIYACNLQQ